MSGNPPRGRGRGGGGQQQGGNVPYRPRGDFGDGNRGGGGRGGDRGGGYRGGDRGGRGDSGRGGYGGQPQGSIFQPAYGIVRDAAHAAREDAIIKTLTASSKKEPALPLRPAYGTKGKPVLLWTNYLHLDLGKDVVVHRYSVGVVVVPAGRATPPALIKRIVHIYLDDVLRPQSIDAVSDFRGTIISRTLISDEHLTADIVYRAEGETQPEEEAKTYRITLKHVDPPLNLGTVLNHVTSTNASDLLSQRQELIQVMNLVVGHAPKTAPGTFTVGRNLHVRPGDQVPGPLSGGLQAMRAFIYSVRAATERLLINVQIKNLPFYTPARLDAAAQLVLSQNQQNNSALASFVKRLSVEVTHIQRRSKSGKISPRYKTIYDLATTSDGAQLTHRPRMRGNYPGPKLVEFWLEEEPKPSQPSGKGKGKKQAETPTTGPSKGQGGTGRYISVFDFFKLRYPQITIGNPALPVVNVGSRSDPSYLPMEVCTIRAGQAARGKPDPKQTMEMINFAVRRPEQNAHSINTTGIALLGLDGNNTHMSAFGMRATPQLLTVPGRILMAPKVKYLSGGMNTFAASWNLQGIKLLKGFPLSTWGYLAISVAGQRPTNFPALIQAADLFEKKLREVGLRADQGAKEKMVVSMQGAVEIDMMIKRLATEKRWNLVVVVLPGGSNTWIYNRVKTACDVQSGILCQCLLEDKFTKPGNDQYFANVALKVNLKLGGSNHTLDRYTATQPITFGSISFKTTMFVGIDVTHPSPGSSSAAPSVASIVSSVEETLGQWPAALRIQTARQEMVDALDELLQNQLKLWQKKNNKTLPKNIIVYRDGVSEGQYQVVLDSELPSLKAAINAVYTPGDLKIYQPKLAIIVVGKRHHTRFYPTSNDNSTMNAKTGNPSNGTVVDRGVTEAANWDFFLQAHAAIKGTAKPAHYYVVYDEILGKSGGANAADNLEDLTHHLCYLFGRATKAVSVCPPAYYADLVCERARCYLSHLLSPQASAAGSSAGNAPVMPLDQTLVTVHERIREKMFYI